MTHSMLKTMLILPLLLAGARSAKSASVNPSETYGYWSDEGGGGSSYLGVDTSDITADRVGPLHLKEERGVEVTMVDQDAPAGKAGLREHDVILNINGDAIQGVEQLRRIIHEIPPGRNLSIGISRDGQLMTVQAQLGRRKDFSLVGPEVKFAMPNLTTLPEIDIPAALVVVHSSGHSGLMVENMSPQLSDFFGAKEGEGILVRSVEKGSCAEKAGFHAGDVIVRVNGQSVKDAGDFGQALRNRKSNLVNVSIIRGRKEQNLTLTLPELRHTGEESIGMEEIGASTEREMSELKSKLAQLKPQINLAVREFKDMRPQIEKQIEDLCRQEKEWRKEEKEMIGVSPDDQQELMQDLHELQEESRPTLEITKPQADI